MASVYTPGTNSPHSCPANSQASSFHKKSSPRGPAVPCAGKAEPHSALARAPQCPGLGKTLSRASSGGRGQPWLQTRVSALWIWGFKALGEATVLSYPGRSQGPHKGITAASPRGIFLPSFPKVLSPPGKDDPSSWCFLLLLQIASLWSS